MKVRTEARRDAIVEAATKLFQEVGYERASMNELAKRLGGSKATLYGYFVSKEDLFGAVVREVATAHLSDAIEELHAPSPEAAGLQSVLQRFGERMLQVLSNDTIAMAVYRMVIAEAGRSEVGELFYQSGPSQAGAAMARILEAAMERGQLRRTDPLVSALQLFGLITAEVQVRMYQRDPPPIAAADIRAMVRRGVEMFLLGAAPRSSSDQAPRPPGTTRKTRARA